VGSSPIASTAAAAHRHADRPRGVLRRLAIGTQLGFANVIYCMRSPPSARLFSALDGPARVRSRQVSSSTGSYRGDGLNQILFQTAPSPSRSRGGRHPHVRCGGRYWIDVASFVVAIVAVTALVAPAARGSRPFAGRSGTRRRLAHFRASRILFGTMLLDFLATFSARRGRSFPSTPTASSPSAAGPRLLFAAPGVGALVAALTSGWTKRVRRQGVAVLVAVAAWAWPSLASVS